MRRFIQTLLVLPAMCLCFTGADVYAAPGGASGNPQYNDSGTFDGVADVIHAASNTLSSAFSSCPSGNTPCDVIADPGYNYTIGNTPLAVGSSTKPETLFIDQATITCNGTAGADCIDIYEKGHVIGLGFGSPGSSAGGYIASASSANITSLVTNGNHTNQDGFDLENVIFSPNTSSTISQAELWLSSTDGFGYVTNVDWTTPPNGGTELLIDDGAASGDYLNDITFVRLGVTCGGANGATAVKIRHNAGSGGSNLTFVGGAIVDCGSGGALLSIDGGPSGQIQDVSFLGTYFETYSGFSGDIIALNNVNDVNLIGVRFNGGPTAANCIHITGNSPGQLFATGRATGNQCTNLINNAKTSYANPSAGDFEYIYPGTNSAGLVTDAGAATPTFMAGLAAGKLASSPSLAIGAGSCQLFAVAGTNSGTCKLQAICGTSTTPATIADNIGSGC